MESVSNLLTQGPRIVDLQRLSAVDLEPLLAEETAEWRRELDWDYSKSADLVRKFADRSGLTGAALLDGGEVAGYGYLGIEEHKGLIWDVYVRARWRTGNAEAVLFSVLLDALIANPDVFRVESQLMLAQNAAAEALRRDRLVQSFERLLMTRDSGTPLPPGRASNNAGFHIEPWNDRRHYDPAATVLSLAYAGHIDAQISNHYRTFAEAFRAVHALVQFPGCAVFSAPASYVAFDTATRRPAGISLASFIAEDVAHITELCVTPEARGCGLGYELLRQSARTLCSAGAKHISLTVTAANEDALRLYIRCGFREVRRFHACVWER